VRSWGNTGTNQKPVASIKLFTRPEMGLHMYLHTLLRSCGGTNPLGQSAQGKVVASGRHPPLVLQLERTADKSCVWICLSSPSLEAENLQRSRGLRLGNLLEWTEI